MLKTFLSDHTPVRAARINPELANWQLCLVCDRIGRYRTVWTVWGRRRLASWTTCTPLPSCPTPSLWLETRKWWASSSHTCTRSPAQRVRQWKLPQRTALLLPPCNIKARHKIRWSLIYMWSLLNTCDWNTWNIETQISTLKEYSLWLLWLAGGTRHWSRAGASGTTLDSLEVEMTSYVLLALLSGPDLPDFGLDYSSGIVRWLTQQQNPYGGFSSTQVGPTTHKWFTRNL